MEACISRNFTIKMYKTVHTKFSLLLFVSHYRPWKGHQQLIVFLLNSRNPLICLENSGLGENNRLYMFHELDCYFIYLISLP